MHLRIEYLDFEQIKDEFTIVSFTFTNFEQLGSVRLQHLVIWTKFAVFCGNFDVLHFSLSKLRFNKSRAEGRLSRVLRRGGGN